MVLSRDGLLRGSKRQEVNVQSNRFSLRLSALCFLWLTIDVPAITISAESVAARPNIVYIKADDLGWTDLACQGSQFYETPRIDRLAAQGMTFTQAYAPAANCQPSRACCLTGQYSPRHGIYTVGTAERGNARDRKLIPTRNRTVLADAEVTIAEVLRSAGYATCHVGKWHLGPDPKSQGFDVNIAGRQWGSPSGGGYHSPYKYPNCVQSKPGEYLTDRLGMEACRFIAANRTQPFFLHFATYAVHSPLQAKAELIETYQEKTGTEAHRNSVYAAMIQSLDENVGRILDVLNELGLAENTLVLFSSDNGGVWQTSRQWPLRAGKGAYYEGGIREPLFVRWPGKIKPGSRCDVPVSGIDFFPTLLAASGVEPPAGKTLDGVNLLPLLTQTGSIPQRPLFWHFPVYLEGGNAETRDTTFRTRPGSVVRLGDWKLHEYFEDGGLELYNLKDDVGEKNNLAASQPDTTRKLHLLLNEWRKATNAPVPRESNPQYRP